ncbi:hypothetical protein CR513_12544, partial [Mucuna pruriens]
MRCPNSPFFSLRSLMFGVDFMGPFPISYGYAYILLVDYVEAKAIKLMMLKLLWVLLDPIFFASLVCLKLS